MKHWLKYALLGLVMLVLVACQSAEESTTTLFIEDNGLSVEITLIAEGDEVTEQTTVNEVTYESLGVSTEEEAEEMLSEFVEGYDTTEGITHDLHYQDERLIETLSLDYETLDFEEASQLTGVYFEGDTSEGISLQRTVDLLEEQGFEKVN